MQIERVRPAVLQVTLHATELSSLVAAARWLVEETPGELPEEARGQLQLVLDSYDQQLGRLDR